METTEEVALEALILLREENLDENAKVESTSSSESDSESDHLAAALPAATADVGVDEDPSKPAGSSSIRAVSSSR